MPRSLPLPSRLAWAALLLASPAFGQDRSDVIDDAKMFSPDAVRQARAELANIDRTHRVAVTVETIESLKGQTINEATERRAEQLDHKGIFILLANRDHKVQVIASRQYRDKLTQPRLVAIRDAFIEQLRAGKADEGLLRGIKAAGSALDEVMPPASRERAEGTTEPTFRNIAKGPSPLIAQNRVDLTLAGARKVLEGAEARAASLGLKSNIAVVDDGGHLLAFARMDGGRPASVATSITKATSAATFRQASGPLPVGGAPDLLLNLGIQDAALAGGAKVTSLKGGLPLVVDGQVIGAIGVAGGTSEQDVEVAKAGVDAFAADVAATTAKPADAPKASESPKATEAPKP